MSRFVRKAGIGGGGGSYGDANVCSLLSSYTGTLTASNGYNICNLRSGWERIYFDCGTNTTFGTICITVDTEKYDAFCITMRGLCGTCTTSSLWTSLGTSNCFCTCINSSFYACYLNSYGICSYTPSGTGQIAGGQRCVGQCPTNYGLLVQKNYSGLRACENIDGRVWTDMAWFSRPITVPSLSWSNFARVAINGCCICAKCATIEVIAKPNTLGELGVS